MKKFTLKCFTLPSPALNITVVFLFPSFGLVTSSGGNHHLIRARLALASALGWAMACGADTGCPAPWSCNQREGCSAAGDEVHWMEISNSPNPPPVQRGSTLSTLRLVKLNVSVEGLVSQDLHSFLQPGEQQECGQGTSSPLSFTLGGRLACLPYSRASCPATSRAACHRLVMDKLLPTSPCFLFPLRNLFSFARLQPRI